MSSNSHFLNKKINKRLDDQYQKVFNRIGIDRKTVDEVFDTSTLLTLEKLISNRIIDYIDFPISTGKEGNVFLGYTPEKKQIAIKIYRISTATFKHITNYLLGDPRFQSIHKSRRDIIYAWASKEFKNLQRLQLMHIPCPKPIIKSNNVLVMEYIGNQQKSAPLLKDVLLDNPENAYKQIIKYIRDMYQKAHLVHCDLSPYNILVFNNTYYIIDLGQGVLLDHPQSKVFLKRDIENITTYFKKYQITEDPIKIYNKIVKQRDE